MISKCMKISESFRALFFNAGQKKITLMTMPYTQMGKIPTKRFKCKIAAKMALERHDDKKI